MNREFIQRATQFSVFNFTSSDFTSTLYQKEIRHLFLTYFFPKLTEKDIIISSLDQGNVNRVINKLRNSSPEKFRQLFKYPVKGVGDGEVLLYFIMKDSKLGGGLSAGSDVFVGTSPYEVKSAVITKSPQKMARNIKVGGTFSLSGIIDKLDALRKDLNLSGNKQVINTSVLETMSKLKPKQYEDIETEYGKLLYDKYFGRHKSIFFNEKTGDVVSIKIPKANEIKMNVLTQSTIKPQILL